MWSFELLGGNVCYEDINMTEHNILNIGDGQWNLDNSLSNLNSRIETYELLIDSNSL